MAATGETTALLLDEHTAAPGPQTGEFVLDLARSLVRDLVLTAIMVTHSMVQARHTGQRTIMFCHGRIVFDAKGPERDRMRMADLLALFKPNRARNWLTIRFCQADRVGARCPGSKSSIMKRRQPPARRLQPGKGGRWQGR